MSNELGATRSYTNNTETLANYAWDYDAADRIIQLTSPDRISNYHYDSTNQLIEADHSYQNDETYSYDGNGNRTNTGDNTGDNTGENNRLQSDGLYDYEYEGEGNLIKQTEIATGEVSEYNWDYRDRLTQVLTKDSAGQIVALMQYAYDVDNRRISKSVDSDGTGNGAAIIERLVYDGEHIALTFDGNGTQTHRSSS